MHAIPQDAEALPDGQDIDLAALRRQLETVNSRAAYKSASLSDMIVIVINALEIERRTRRALETRVKSLTAQLHAAEATLVAMESSQRASGI